MDQNLQDKVISHFKEISRIPRCSKQEEKISEYLKSWGESHGLDTRRDAVGNVVIRKPGSPGREEEDPIILQGHMDMVCEKIPESSHDFSKDPIPLREEGSWLLSKETTLGADNGIALAMMLTVLEDSGLSHPPLEALFTVDEEEGMTGAINLDSSMVSGKRMINLDSETEGTMVVACAGGENDILEFPLTSTDQREKAFFLVSISGLQGGHSGMDVLKGRGNANTLLGEVIQSLSRKFSLIGGEFQGGTKHNAIPREASAILGCNSDEEGSFRDQLEILQARWKKEYERNDEHLKIQGIPCTVSPGTILFDRESVGKVGDILCGLPAGVVKMNASNPQMVESSSNPGVLSTEKTCIRIVSGVRSGKEEYRRDIREIHQELCREYSGKLTVKDEYPGWTYAEKSPLREKAKTVYQTLFGGSLKEEGIHAGLECGYFDEILNHPDMISIGPDIEGPHAPGEKLNVESTGRVARFLVKLLQES